LQRGNAREGSTGSTGKLLQILGRCAAVLLEAGVSAAPIAECFERIVASATTELAIEACLGWIVSGASGLLADPPTSAASTVAAAVGRLSIKGMHLSAWRPVQQLVETSSNPVVRAALIGCSPRTEKHEPPVCEESPTPSKIRRTEQVEHRGSAWRMSREEHSREVRQKQQAQVAPMVTRSGW